MNHNIQQKSDSRTRRKIEYKKRERRSWILLLVSALTIALLLRFFVFEFIRVDGRSMEDTLHSNEYVFMERVTYWFREPAYGDVIICTFPDEPGKTFVKRVIGTGGDTLEISDGVLYINDEPDYNFFEGSMYGEFGPVVVPQSSVFVMGDNRNNSLDSRNAGALSFEHVLGKAPFVIWPLFEIRGL